MAADKLREFSAKVPEEEYQAFRENFPQYGATNWFINTALATFNARIKEEPGVKEVIDAAIDDMLRTRRESPTA